MARTINQFILRSRVLSFYRQCLRASRGFTGGLTRESRQWVRGEFERNRAVSDPQHIKFLLDMGKIELKQTCKFVR